jgi:hypothetical protein
MSSALRNLSSNPIDDAADFGRHIRDRAVDGTSSIVKRADLPRLVEAGRDSAASVVSDAVDRVTGRRRRRGPSPFVSVTVVAALLALGLGAWWFIRSGRLSALRAPSDDEPNDNLSAADDRALDVVALARANDDGMGIGGGTVNTATAPVSSVNGLVGAGSHSNE